jgi:hypothetical protein
VGFVVVGGTNEELLYAQTADDTNKTATIKARITIPKSEILDESGGRRPAMVAVGRDDAGLEPNVVEHHRPIRHNRLFRRLIDGHVVDIRVGVYEHHDVAASVEWKIQHDDYGDRLQHIDHGLGAADRR